MDIHTLMLQSPNLIRKNNMPYRKCNVPIALPCDHDLSDDVRGVRGPNGLCPGPCHIGLFHDDELFLDDAPVNV